MVGSTGTIKTMRLLRNKQHHNNKRVEESATAVDNSTPIAAASAFTMDASSHNKNKRHNASITSNTSSVSSTSSTASSATSTSSSRHHHHHQRSLSMRDQYLDLPYDDATAPADQPAIAYRQSPASVWVFPPLPPQPNLYCNNTQVSMDGSGVYLRSHRVANSIVELNPISGTYMTS